MHGYLWRQSDDVHLCNDHFTSRPGYILNIFILEEWMLKSHDGGEKGARELFQTFSSELCAHEFYDCETNCDLYSLMSLGCCDHSL